MRGGSCVQRAAKEGESVGERKVEEVRGRGGRAVEREGWGGRV